MAPSKANAPEYSKDEKVLCFHLELLYEAKVLDVKPKDPNDKGDGYVYKIHYKGWKNTYVFLSFLCFPFLLLVDSDLSLARREGNGDYYERSELQCRDDETACTTRALSLGWSSCYSELCSDGISATSSRRLQLVLMATC